MKRRSVPLAGYPPLEGMEYAANSKSRATGGRATAPGSFRGTGYAGSLWYLYAVP